MILFIIDMVVQTGIDEKLLIVICKEASSHDYFINTIYSLAHLIKIYRFRLGISYQSFLDI
jgi:hypothetical protein